MVIKNLMAAEQTKREGNFLKLFSTQMLNQSTSARLPYNVEALAKKGLYSTSLNDSTKVKLINKSSITFVRPFFANILLAAVFRQPIT
jgi:hypothetical protein